MTGPTPQAARDLAGKLDRERRHTPGEAARRTMEEAAAMLRAFPWGAPGQARAPAATIGLGTWRGARHVPGPGTMGAGVTFLGFEREVVFDVAEPGRVTVTIPPEGVPTVELEPMVPDAGTEHGASHE